MKHEEARALAKSVLSGTPKSYVEASRQLAEFVRDLPDTGYRLEESVTGARKVTIYAGGQIRHACEHAPEETHPDKATETHHVSWCKRDAECVCFNPNEDRPSDATTRDPAKVAEAFRVVLESIAATSDDQETRTLASAILNEPGHRTSEQRGSLRDLAEELGVARVDVPRKEPVSAEAMGPAPDSETPASVQLEWVLRGVADGKAPVEWAKETIARFIVKLVEAARENDQRRESAADAPPQDDFTRAGVWILENPEDAGTFDDYRAKLTSLLEGVRRDERARCRERAILPYACVGGLEGCEGSSASSGPCASCAAVIASARMQALEKVAETAREWVRLQGNERARGKAWATTELQKRLTALDALRSSCPAPAQDAKEKG